jgi:alkylation response protein AidB-like acyl-CoA dehydrogenase
LVDELLAALGAFLDTAAPRHREKWGEDEGWDARIDWQRSMADGGWAAPAWPSEHGGRDAGVYELLAIEATVAAAGMQLLPGTLGLKNVAPTILAWGTEEQKAHLPGIYRADEIWCQGFSEPGAGSDLASLATTAVPDGDHFVVNGQKIWTSYGHRATHMELLVRTDPDAPKHRGISVLLLDMATCGVEARPIRQINGAQDFAEVFLTDVRVPKSALLGPLNKGWTVTRTTLGHERSGAALFTARLEKDATALVEAHTVKQRGEPLDPVHRDEVVKRFIETRVLSALSRQMIARLDAGEEPGAAQSIIKLVFSETRQRLAATALELEETGGVVSPTATTLPSTMEYLAARSATIAAGTSQIVRTLLAERVLGMPR